MASQPQTQIVFKRPKNTVDGRRVVHEKDGAANGTAERRGTSKGEQQVESEDRKGDYDQRRGTGKSDSAREREEYVRKREHEELRRIQITARRQREREREEELRFEQEKARQEELERALRETETLPEERFTLRRDRRRN
ncbi:hypothetical protein SBOR_5519 [Sclerotinia borealis F-4128]|uniref:Uncharacterized protein n=1 Tax=Sclerotinia borealis (strain F-4128) TaxID=1432307 RepID=W9CH75_SCLBF|nr:hypothetical protein SBOR_5519 [Sclerotinia borealis F-4128]